MFARILTMDVKPGQTIALGAAVEQTVLPTLRRFEGFRDLVSMISPDGKMVGISFWDSAPEAAEYEREAWPEVLELYRSFADSTPVLTKYDLIVSTAYEIRGLAIGA